MLLSQRMRERVKNFEDFLSTVLIFVKNLGVQKVKSTYYNHKRKQILKRLIARKRNCITTGISKG